MKMVSSSNPEARRVGTRTPGRDLAVAFGDCQKITSRPRAVVNTNWARFSRGRSSTRSMATPRRRQDRTGTSSRIWGACGQSAEWQYSLAVRGQVSAVLSTTSPSGNGSRTRKPSFEPSSGLRATTKVGARSRSGMATHPAAPVHGAAQLVLIQDRQILGHEVGGHPGEERQLLVGVLGGEQPHPLEALDVAVDRLLGVVGAASDLRGSQPFEVE